ncbi:MAG TPA: hypothetical protein PLD30_02880, partial [Candidatus Competibacteraceae bacterium]|nr:hypothetical protein [Candidatus Competibacteraceae bacterium]
IFFMIINQIDKSDKVELEYGLIIKILIPQKETAHIKIPTKIVLRIIVVLEIAAKTRVERHTKASKGNMEYLEDAACQIPIPLRVDVAIRATNTTKYITNFKKQLLYRLEK